MPQNIYGGYVGWCTQAGAAYILDRDLNAEVATSDHDAVGDLQDLVEVFEALLRLDLAEDHDAAARHAQNLADVGYILRLFTHMIRHSVYPIIPYISSSNDHYTIE